jgi:flagellar L-ring protein precursor FlgH
MRRALLLAMVALPLCGCDSLLKRLEDGAGPPKMTPTSDPTKDPNWQPVSLPMPPPPPQATSSNSLWRPGSRAFFPDQRAAHVGDIVTVVVNITDTANVKDASTATRTGSETMGVPNLFGLESKIPKILGGATASSLVSTNSTGSTVGTGEVNRSEAITVRVAGVITQVLPNGNFAIVARQEVRVNSELREMEISGVVRPQDIASDNTVQHDRMAEARISYGGRGQLTDVNQPRYGQQMLDILLPF